MLTALSKMLGENEAGVDGVIVMSILMFLTSLLPEYFSSVIMVKFSNKID